MILDLFLGFWLILSGLMGFRDGSVRKLASIIMTVVALVVGQLFIRETGDLMIETFAADQADAPMLGFLFVFFGIVLAQSIVYRVVTHAYKIGGFVDRLGGAILGVFHGIVLLSSFLFILSFAGVPSKRTKAESRIYRSIVNVAPQILDLFMTIRNESIEGLEEQGSSLDAKKASPVYRRTNRR